MADLGNLASKLLSGAAGLPDDTLKLAINGNFYEGWQSVSVKRSIKAISGAFDLGVTTKWADEMTPWGIQPGDSSVLLIGKEALITGFVDDVNADVDANDRSMSVSGRDTSADIVDCSIDQNPSAWTNISLTSLAKRLTKQFGVGVTVDASVSAAASVIFPAWKINQGETVFGTLDRAAKMRGVLLTNDGQGNIVLTRAGTSKASSDLVQGENILSARAAFSVRERYSQYTVKAQSGGLDGADPEVDFSPSGSARDPGVTRFRPIIIVAEGAATSLVCRERAQWEVAVRIGRSSRINVSTPGWRQSDGTLWRPNQLCRLKAPTLGLNIELLITEVTLRKGNEGTTSQLLLEPASAYVPDPTLITRKEPWRQLVMQESARK